MKSVRNFSCVSCTVLLLFAADCFAKTVVNDITQLNPIEVAQVVAPTSIEEIQNIVRNNAGPISIGGGRYSMGGQTATEHAVQIDMRSMNKIIAIDQKAKTITVEAGIRWRAIQEVIDPLNLSLKIMQTYANFTVGGSLSVNVHGRYVGQGPLIGSVLTIKIVLADGTIVQASRSENSDIFYGAIGGYGGLGVIVSATLQLTDNEKVERQVKLVKTGQYHNFFLREIRHDPEAVFHNGDIYPPDFDQVQAVTWVRTKKELTIKDRLIPSGEKYWLQPSMIEAISTAPYGRQLRSKVIDPVLYHKPVIAWRNHEASYDVAELEPKSRAKTTYVLQEYFVPLNRFDEFVLKMRHVFNHYNVNVINVSIRHALADSGSLLAWAPEEVFAFVVYYKQETTSKSREKVGIWTRELIETALSVGGRYYLPYQIHATDDQFQRAYPGLKKFVELKKRLDPENKFRNKLWDRYYHFQARGY